jgi:hypothetical protein
VRLSPVWAAGAGTWVSANGRAQASPREEDTRADRDARNQAIGAEQEKTHFDLPVQRRHSSGNPGSEDFSAA